MLHIILMILKVIGILILVVLALLLLITGLVMFVPIRYRVNGKKDAEGLYIKAEVYWLLHLFRLKAVYPEPGQIIAKVLWFTVYDSKKEEEPEKTGENKTKKTKKVKTSKKERKLQKEETKQINPEIETKDTMKKAAEQRNSDASETEIELEKEAVPEKETETEIEKGKIGQVIDKIKAIIQKVLEILKNIRYTIRRLCDKIKEIWANIQYYIEVFNEEETSRAFSMCKQQLYKIWKNIRPSKCRAELKIGTGEPDTTGYILAVHGMLYPLIGNNVFIEPDFENQVYEGTIFIKGRITVFVLLCAAIKLYLDKDIKHFLKRFKREE